MVEELRMTQLRTSQIQRKGLYYKDRYRFTKKFHDLPQFPTMKFGYECHRSGNECEIFALSMPLRFLMLN